MIYALDANTISFFLMGEGNVAGNFQERIVEAESPYVIPVGFRLEWFWKAWKPEIK